MRYLLLSGRSCLCGLWCCRVQQSNGDRERSEIGKRTRSELSTHWGGTEFPDQICLPRIKRRTSHLCPRIRWYRPPSRKGWNEARGTSEPGWRRAHWPASSWHEVAVPPARSSLLSAAESAWGLRGHDARWIWRMCWRSKVKRARDRYHALLLVLITP